MSGHTRIISILWLLDNIVSQCICAETRVRGHAHVVPMCVGRRVRRRIAHGGRVLKQGVAARRRMGNSIHFNRSPAAASTAD